MAGEGVTLPIVRVITEIRAPIERCFDLARSIDLHVQSTPGTEERAIAGVTTGAIGMGEEVTWEARHLGVRQQLTSRITRFDRPHHFRDSQVRGAFQRFDHDHVFTARASITVMTDVFDYQSPYGLFGRCADRLFLEEYLRRFLTTRAECIKRAAESATAGPRSAAAADPAPSDT